MIEVGLLTLNSPINRHIGT